MTLAEVEAAAITLPFEEQKQLLRSLEEHIRKTDPTSPTTHSVLDIPPVSIGTILSPLTQDDDLLDEMLEGRM